MQRRELLKWFLRIAGGYAAVSASPLTRINTTLFNEAHAQEPCTQDTCTTQDNCGATDTVGHTCELKDVCDTDASGNCKNDECESDSSSHCEGDHCVSDKSGACTGDTCVSDSSGECTGDSCSSDSSGACTGDSCSSDSSGACTTDECVSDSSQSCVNDKCTSDASGACTNDTCISDSSGYCEGDTCVSDSSGECTGDTCTSDSSGSCTGDSCTSDSSGSCTGDSCTPDKSGACTGDTCQSDNSGACEKDVCILDFSSSCHSDVCREDRSPLVCGTDIDCTNDTCSLDLALNHNLSRRHLAKAGINQAIKWLYKLSIMILFIALAHGASHAATVIDATNAVFLPRPTYMTSQAVSVQSPVGPFLRDCDGDGILEADTNGDGQCAGDPEVKDYNGDGSKELPPETAFAGNFQFTCFHIPSDVAIIATGPLTIKASQEVAIFGAMKLNSGAEISSPEKIDLRTSAWLSETGNITFMTALAGEVDETQTGFGTDTVPPIAYNSVCSQQQPAVAVPTLTEWGLILLLVLTGIAAVYRLRKVGA